MKTALRHALLITMNDTLDWYADGYIVFDDAVITAVGNDRDYCPAPDIHEIDAAGSLVLPAFINLHTHLGMASFRSLGDDMPDRLNRFLFPLENECMTAELAAASSRLCMAELLLSGTATAVDMYYFEEQVMDAAAAMHMRLWAGETLLDAPHCDADGFLAGLERTDRLLERTTPLVNVICAPHAPHSVSLDHLKSVRDYARSNGLRWTMHVAEMASEDVAARNLSGCSPVGLLARQGLLDDHLLAAHTLYADDADLPVLADCGVTVVHCPVSNAKAAKGVARIDAMMKRGVCVTLGTDGPASGNTLDMFTQMKSAVILQKNLLHDRAAMPASQILALATRNAGKALGAPLGILTPGYQADILMLCARDVNMMPVHDVYSAVVYSAQPQNVERLWVAGRCVVSDRTLCGVSRAAVVDEFVRYSAAFDAAVQRH